ncbi:hypothetical protein AR276_22660 [Stenotrophomonas maltophilia]|nr:hypothetical protein AR276_22660 [Stenotrophomonas maltophilia]
MEGVTCWENAGGATSAVVDSSSLTKARLIFIVNSPFHRLKSTTQSIVQLLTFRSVMLIPA